MSHETDPNQPYVERPDQMDDDTDGAICFLDPSTVCGAHCTSWRTFPIGSQGEMTEKQQHCLVLSSLHILAKHVAIMAGMMLDDAKAQKNAEADRRRQQELKELDPSAG